MDFIPIIVRFIGAAILNPSIRQVGPNMAAMGTKMAAIGTKMAAN